jgi:hypothetical protein
MLIFDFQSAFYLSGKPVFTPVFQNICSGKNLNLTPMGKCRSQSEAFQRYPGGLSSKYI